MNVLKFKPPMCFTKENVDLVREKLEEVLGSSEELLGDYNENCALKLTDRELRDTPRHVHLNGGGILCTVEPGDPENLLATTGAPTKKRKLSQA